MSKEIELKLRNILKELLDVERAEKIGLTDKLSNLGIHSVSFMKLVIAIEKEFGFEFEDANLKFSKFPDLQSLLSYINERLSSR